MQEKKKEGGERDENFEKEQRIGRKINQLRGEGKMKQSGGHPLPPPPSSLGNHGNMPVTVRWKVRYSTSGSSSLKCGQVWSTVLLGCVVVRGLYSHGDAFSTFTESF